MRLRGRAIGTVATVLVCGISACRTWGPGEPLPRGDLESPLRLELTTGERLTVHRASVQGDSVVVGRSRALLFPHRYRIPVGRVQAVSRRTFSIRRTLLGLAALGAATWWCIAECDWPIWRFGLS